MIDKNRVKKRRDFTRVYQKGKSVAAKDLVLCWRKTGLPVHRVGFTVSKKVGNAVVKRRAQQLLADSDLVELLIVESVEGDANVWELPPDKGREWGLEQE